MSKKIVEAIVALRTPMIISIIGLLVLFVDTQYLVVNSVMFFHDTVSFKIFGMPDEWHWDYFLYPPNTIIHILCFLFGIIAIELRNRYLPKNGTWQADAATLWACLFLAALPLLFTTIDGFRMNLIRSILVQVAVYFAFFTINADLHVYRRFIESRSWFKRTCTCTFPISDIAFCSSHRKNVAEINPRYQYLPAAFYLVLAAGLILTRAGIAYGSIQAEKIDIDYLGAIEIDDTYYSQWVGDELWFTNTDWEDGTSGVWIYRESDGKAGPLLSVFDPHSFHLENNEIYVFDRLLYNQVQKVELPSRNVIWNAPVKQAGSYILRMNEDLILAVGELGYMYSFRKEDGSLHAEKRFGTTLYYAELLKNGEVIFLSGDPVVHYLDRNLNQRGKIYLPPLVEHPELRARFEESGFKLVSIWAYYSRAKDLLYVTAMWGEIYVLDLKTLQWIRTYEVKPGVRTITVDETNNLLFAAQFIQGYIEVLDLGTGEQLGTILTAGTGRHVNLDPANQRGIYHTNGRGMFQFDYSELRPKN